jgi:hypothetical protein
LLRRRHVRLLLLLRLRLLGLLLLGLLLRLL